MSDNLEKCTIDVPIDDPWPVVTGKPSESELDELLAPLVDWQVFVRFVAQLHGVPRYRVKVIEKEKSSVKHRKLAVLSEWVKVNPFASWMDVIKALAAVNEDSLAVSICHTVAKRQHNKNVELNIPESVDVLVLDHNELNKGGTYTCTSNCNEIQEKTNASCLLAFKNGNYSEALILLPFTIDPKTIHTSIDDTNLPYDDIYDPKSTVGLLHLAAWNGWLDVMKILISKYSFDPEKGGYSIYTFHTAVMSKHIEVVKYLIAECSCDPMSRAKHGSTSLHFAGKCGSIDVLRYLITECNCDPIVTNDYGTTCLHIAVANSHFDLVKYLIAKCSCDPMVKDKNGSTSLHFAGKSGSINVLRYLITECNCDPIVTNKYGATCLHIAVANNHFDVVKYLTTECRCDPLVKDNKGSTPLHYAGKSGSISIMKYLVANCKCNPMVTNKYGATCLHIALMNNHIDVVKYLIGECRCDLMSKDNDGWTSLHYAGRGGSLDIMKYLVSRCKCNPMVTNNDGATCLHIAVMNNQFDVVKYLIAKCRCDPMSRDYERRTSLHYAGKGGSINIVKYLVAKCNCNPMVANKHGETCLQIAVANQHIDVVKYLIAECKCNPMVTNKKGASCLHIAVANKHFDVVKYLVREYNCDPMSKDENGWTSLHCAGQNGSLDLMKYFVSECKCDPMVTNKDGATCLHYAVANKHIGVVKYLVGECNCDPMSKDDEGWTSLHNAGECGSLDIMRYLIAECKCNPMVVNKNGASCLHIAIANKRVDVVKYLIDECRCDPMSRDYEGLTCYHYAGDCGSLDIMKCLSLRGNPMVINNDGATCLHIAVTNEHIDVVKYLIAECSCDPMSKDYEKWTCLHYASQVGSLDIMKYLLTECRCNPMVSNINGATCLDIAVANDHFELAKYLIAECSCDPMNKDNKGWTSLHYAGHVGSLNVMKYLTSECKCNPMVTNIKGATCLHIAVVNNHFDVVKYLVSECSCDPTSRDNRGWTSLHYAGKAGSVKIIKYLINECHCDPMVANKKGATCLDVAIASNCFHVVEYLLSTGKLGKIKLARFKRLSSKFDLRKKSHPVDSYVNVLLLGNSKAGKSTLAKVISERGNKGNLNFVSLSSKTVEAVEPHTAGIIPIKMQHKELGNIILYDFAGHSGYYTSHTAVIENLLQGSAAVFVIMVNILEAEASLSLQQWLTVVVNKAFLLQRCHIIIVFSHFDKLTDGSIKEKRQIELQQVIKRNGVDASVVYLDCCRIGGTRVNSFFSNLSIACQSIRDTSEKCFDLYCNMMYGLLEESKENTLTFSDIVSIAARSNTNEYILPNEENELLQLLFYLDSTGLVSLLKADDSKIWVVVNKQILLSEVNGILFAPKPFKEYCSIASDTGIISFSDLSRVFHLYDPEMLMCFLKRMAICQEINSNDFKWTNFMAQDIDTLDDDEERFLFFPSLISIKRPDHINQHVFQFGWCLQCIRDYHFFPSHFLHNLILQLSIKYGLPGHSSTLNHQCTYWKKGIHWFDGNGVETLVELVSENQCVVVLMSCDKECRKNMVSLRRDIITEITSVQKQYCPSLKLLDFLIDPEDLKYPIDRPTQRVVYKIEDILLCIINRKEFVISAFKSTHKHLMQLLPDENVQLRQLSILGSHDLEKLTITERTQPLTTTDQTVHQQMMQMSPDRNVLGLKNLDDVFEILHSNRFANCHWSNLGIHLGLYKSTLADIDDKCRSDPHKCLQECLAAWLKKEDKVANKGNPSWYSLAAALDKIEEYKIATIIRKL